VGELDGPGSTSEREGRTLLKKGGNANRKKDVEKMPCRGKRETGKRGKKKAWGGGALHKQRAKEGGKRGKFLFLAASFAFLNRKTYNSRGEENPTGPVFLGGPLLKESSGLFSATPGNHSFEEFIRLKFQISREKIALLEGSKILGQEKRGRSLYEDRNESSPLF